MKVLTMSVLGLALIGLFIPMKGARAEETSVTILSPAEGAVISTSEVPMEIKFVKGVKGDHLHFYLDGQFLKTSRRESVTLWDVPDGQHTLTVKAASREKDEKGVEHKELNVNASTTVTVHARMAKKSSETENP